MNAVYVLFAVFMMFNMMTAQDSKSAWPFAVVLIVCLALLAISNM